MHSKGRPALYNLDNRPDNLLVLGKLILIQIVSSALKVLFAIDVDSYKERDTTFVKSAVGLGEISFAVAILCTIIPKSWAKFLGLQPFQAKPVNDLGHFFKKLLKERKATGIKYNDLSEVLVNAVDENKLEMSEDAVIGNILLAFLAGELRDLRDFRSIFGHPRQFSISQL